MKMKKYLILVVVSAVCLLVVVAYQAGKFAGENSEELAFQKEKEATRKAEFAKLQRIYEEEKQAEEKRRREEKSEEREKETTKMLMESRDRQSAIIMKMMKDLQKIGSSKRGGISSKSSEKGPQSSVGLSAAVVGRWQLFETTTIDGWVKKVKRGTIFKTTSGNIYEVVDVVILLEMEVRPDVTVLTDGRFYKLFIRGVDEPLLCRKLNRGKKGTVSGDVIESQINGTFKGWDGETVFKLTNGQIWQQTSYAYTYHYAYRPKVLIYETTEGYKMKVDGVRETIYVKRLKSGSEH